MQGARQVQACPYLLSPRQDNSHVDTQSTPSVTSREVNFDPLVPPIPSFSFFNLGLHAVIFGAQVCHRDNLDETAPSGQSGVSFFSGSPEHNRRALKEITRFTSTGIGVQWRILNRSRKNTCS